jgi:hypothetical protein
MWLAWEYKECCSFVVYLRRLVLSRMDSLDGENTNTLKIPWVFLCL